MDMDINEMIRAQMKSGMSAKEIANAFTDALNKAQEEVNKKNKEADKRADVLDHFRYIFNDAVSHNQFDVNSAATLFALTLAKKHPEWTGEDIMNCYNIAIYTAEITEQTVHKTPDELADLMVNKGIELLDKLLADDNKGEEPDLDEKKLAEFLKMFH
jgi:hypothetical protein